jgi:hypothetical protein
VYNRDRSHEIDDVKGLAAYATKHLELLKQKVEAESSCIIKDSEETAKQNTRPSPFSPPQKHNVFF